MNDFLTVDEAAVQLRVASSTIRRWIRVGDLPAYRIGKRRVGVRKEDVRAMINPVPADSERESMTGAVAEHNIPKLTPEQIRRGLEAMERVKELQKEIMERRGGVPFTPEGWVLINEARDQRSRELAERS